MPPQKKTTRSKPTKPPTPHSQFGQILKDWRKKTDLSQQAIAFQVECDNTQISRFESGSLLPTVRTFHKLLAVYVGYGACLDATEAVEVATAAGIRLTKVDLALVVEMAHKHTPRYAKEFEQTIAAAFTVPGQLQTEVLPQSPLVTGETSKPDNDGAAQFGISTASQTTSTVSGSTRPQPLVIPAIPSDDNLATDEIILAILEWEAQTQQTAATEKLWNLIKFKPCLEKLRSKRRLDFVLAHWVSHPDWNRLEWDWLDHNLADLAQSLATDQTTSSLSAQANLVAELGQIAWAAIKVSDTSPQPKIKLAAVLNLWPASAARLIRQWLDSLIQRSPFQLSISAQDELVFGSADEAQFLAAKYLLETESDDLFNDTWVKDERAQPVLTYITRQLYYSEQTRSLLERLTPVIRPGLFVAPRPLLAARLLAACAPITDASVLDFQHEVEEALVKLWKKSADVVRLEIADIFRDLGSDRLAEQIEIGLQQNADQRSESDWLIDLQCLAICGQASATNLLVWKTRGQYRTAIEVAKWLSANDQALFLENLALADEPYELQTQAIEGLYQAQTVPAYRAIRRIAEKVAHPKTRRYAETRLDFANESVYAGLVAYAIESSRLSRDTTRLLLWVERANSLMGNLLSSKSPSPTPSLTQALARVWADLVVDPNVRWQAAVHLRQHKAHPAFEICLSTLAMLDSLTPDWAFLLESLLVALTTPTSEPAVRAMLAQVTSPAQREVLVKCLHALGKTV